MRNMSFALTTDQIIARTKFVTRRFGWWHLKPGDQLRAVYKTMGLKAGQTVQPIIGADGMPTIIQIVDTRAEPLNAITKDDVIKEGFPWLNRQAFIDMLVEHYRCEQTETVNRIEFTYIGKP